ncbi:MAG: hypothetical protein LRY75_16530 [Shewanella xiamenensis]|jgi:hypothetical protein|uniref:Uncharacterized protein n=1 Tax=Shewanella putrefaciens (strain 200) TaxID=399804 RepID=E6XSF9_SHEP2|nr:MULTISPECIES: hypothetical protein [Shewanella]MCD8552091.1 hypothetical protein [Shewanella xiamenensis]MCD8560379.1 hypothetical protein [Shewanella xiamenensis]MCK7657667.1 hypothetical protein [Shewanella sp. JNE4-2]MCT8858123.1 hypothetical protein [Shewanella xiamenensis]MDH0450970.1 hypothetical protein [Shewanella sp. GD04112]
MSKQIAETTNQLHCIVDEDDNVLADGLTLFEAERQLTIFLNHGEDCYIGDSELQTIRGT